MNADGEGYLKSTMFANLNDFETSFDRACSVQGTESEPSSKALETQHFGFETRRTLRNSLLHTEARDS